MRMLWFSRLLHPCLEALSIRRAANWGNGSDRADGHNREISLDRLPAYLESLAEVALVVPRATASGVTSAGPLAGSHSGFESFTIWSAPNRCYGFDRADWLNSELSLLGPPAFRKAATELALLTMCLRERRQQKQHSENGDPRFHWGLYL